ncbi:MAG: ATP-dependent helicase [Kosmotogaceae bacterium]|nr:ATP-dependent helicase [Kosmotogaceae bacterium]
MKKYTLKSSEIPGFLSEGLDEEQLKAVVESNGRSLIVAGPGSGKTRVITYKIAHLVSSSINPQNILLVTFTRAASREMIDRARRASGSNLQGMLSGTFHHVCNYFLRKYSRAAELNENFTILDREDAKDLIKHCRAELLEERKGINSSTLPSAGVLQSIYSYSVNVLSSLRESTVRKNRKFLGSYDEIEEIWKRYVQEKTHQNCVDYDDLLLKALKLFNENPAILKKESERFRWVLVDEFQDTNVLQFRLVEMLSSVHGNLIVVGDDAQSIYSFRGARFENVYDFLAAKDAKIFKIQTNYRSTPQIVELINTIVPEDSIEKQLRAVRMNGPIPVVADTWDNLEEASFVAQRIQEHIDDGIDPESIAVLYRSHYHSLELQMEMDKRKMNFTLYSGPRFTETAHVKDILAVLKVIENPLDQISWGRSLRLFPGVGNATSLRIIQGITAAVNDGHKPVDVVSSHVSNRVKLDKMVTLFGDIGEEEPPSEIIRRFYTDFYGDYLDEKFADARERRMDVERMIEIAGRYKSISDLLEDLAVSEKIDIERESAEKQPSVVLTTVHQAKGLEWEVVFILAVNPGDFPNSMAIIEGSLSEEERIFYVAVTRAKDYLYILRQKGGRSRPMIGNRYVFRSGHDFVEKLPKDCFERWDVSWDF